MGISAITDYLSILAWPSPADAAALEAAGVRLVIGMTQRVPPPGLIRSPMSWLHVPTRDTPLFPIPLAALFRGVEAALPVIDAGHGVAIHCSRGRHRSVALACAILIARGHTAAEAMTLVKVRRREADPDIWYIRRRILAFEHEWLGRAEAVERPR
jgi:hypothetical protein